ncbi:Hypothetical protein MAU_1800 [Metamycoplasma auris 15026]|uniref:TraG P-loop domain-containing protein n=1 Tax=Metamycoplasma auris 15026 TaxID=1188233 RepID=N9VBT8_9BACT|nr:hypothetical protein [Metamycoplasma auris]ENY69138.1 Hypothetical protein MAU_1800 [Metamycoplasma auris 15026]
MLQNKKLSDVRLQIFRNISLIDMVLIILFAGLSFVLGFLTSKNLPLIARIAIAAGVFGSTFWVVLPNKKHNCKYYVFLIRFFRFHLKPKKYLLGSQSPKLLVAYKEITNGSIVKVNDGSYFSVLSFKGYDVYSNEIDDKMSYYQTVINALDNIDFPISFVKIPKSSNLEANYEYIREKVSKETKVDWEVRNEYFVNNLHDLSTLDITENIDSYYLVIKSGRISDLKNNVSRIQSLFASTPLKLNLLQNASLIDFLNFQFNVELDEIKQEQYLSAQSMKSNSQKSTLVDLLSPKKVIFFKDKIKVDKTFLSYQTINDFNTYQIAEGWANVIFNSPSSVIWNLTPLTLKEKQSILDKTMEKIELNNNDEKSNFARNKNALANEVLAEITQSINIENMNLFNSNLILINKASSAKELREIENINKNNAATIQANLNPNLYLQRLAFLNSTFDIKDYMNNNLEMLSRNVVMGWPWINIDLNDNNNLLWGFSKTTSSPIILDIFKKTKDRTNFSMFFWGVPGAGKSAATSKLFLNYLMNGDSVIVIDPQREYKYLIPKLNGTWIELGKGLETTLNPLQLNAQFSDSNQKVTNHQIVIDNIKKVCVFVKTLYPDFSDNKLRALFIVLKKLYKNWGFFEDTFDVSKAKNEDYPIFDDLIKLLEHYDFGNDIEKEFFDKEIKELWINFRNDFADSGQYQNLYNGITNINITDDDFCVIDTYNLIQDTTSPSAQAAMYLILNFVQNKITNNFVLNKDNKRILIVVDEAHKFINNKNQAIIDFLFDTVKTIRKYNGSLILTTQQPSDFAQDSTIATKTQAIIENIDYSLILRLNQKDLDAVNSMYKNRGGLNKSEITFISSAAIGEGLMNIGSNNRILMQLYYNGFEKETIFKKGDLSQLS